MKVATFCSGIGAPEAAWSKLGWESIFTSEIEPFPCAVLKHHYPDVPNLGNMETITDETLARFRPDVVCAGTPCQSFSIAGLRAGMADARGNLALVFLGHVSKLRPRWLVWENVPGVLSSWSDETEGDGERWQSNDFDTFLCGVRELGYGVAWRILNAEHFGVPQHRRRVFVVGYLGDWRRATAVLFERQSLSGDSAPRRQKGKDFAPTISSRTKGGGGLGTDFDLDDGLIVNAERGGRRQDYETDTLIPMTKPQESLLVAHALRGVGFDGGEDASGRGTPIVPVAFTVHGTNKAVRVVSETEIAGSVGTKAPGSQQNTSTTVVLGFSCKDHGADAGEVSPTLRSMGHSGSHPNSGGQVAIAFAQNTRDEVREMEVAGALAAQPGMKQQTFLRQEMGVRRLTCLECERLMGFPDGFTKIAWNGWRKMGVDETPESCRAAGMEVRQGKNGNWRVKDVDGPRYKALGNSMAVLVLEWIGKRIQMVDELK